MALPESGPIWLSQLRDEFGSREPPNFLTHYYRGGLTTPNNERVPVSGPISLSQFYGASRITPGSRTFGVGSATFEVPLFSWLTIDMRAGGGAGGGGIAMEIHGFPGNASGIWVDDNATGAYALGGNAGMGSASDGMQEANFPGGEPRAQSGGGSGNAGVAKVEIYEGGGGRGGRGGSSIQDGKSLHGQHGGHGGRVVLHVAPNELLPGTLIRVSVGVGGQFIAGDEEWLGYEGAVPPELGEDGSITISWG